MEKEFCTYTQALALKELGFDEPCLIKDTEQGEECAIYYVHDNGKPTFSQAFRWFRDEYNLVFNFISYSIVKPGEYHWSITWHDVAKASGIVKTYEEAESDCLDKLIEICKNK